MCNVDAVQVRDAASSRDSLIRQVTGAVQWEGSMRALIAQGATQFLEAGPGSVLTGLLRQIDRSQKLPQRRKRGHAAEGHWRASRRRVTMPSGDWEHVRALIPASDDSDPGRQPLRRGIFGHARGGAALWLRARGDAGPCDHRDAGAGAHTAAVTELHARSAFGHPRGSSATTGAGLSLHGLHKDGHEIPVEISLSRLETDDGL